MNRWLVVLAGLVLGVSASGQQIAKTKTEVDGLIKTLKTAKEGKQRAAAARSLGETAQVRVALARPAEATLIDALKDADAEVRLAAVQTLETIEPYKKDRIPGLLGLLKDGEGLASKAVAITMLGQVEGGVKEAVPLLEDIRKKELDKAEDQRNGDLLNRIAQSLVTLRQHLLAGYLSAVKTDKDAKVRAVAAAELGKIAKGNAEQAKETVPALIEALKDEDVEVRKAAVVSLEAAKPEPAAVVPTLIANLKNSREDRAVRLGVLVLLNAAGPSAKEALPFVEFIYERELKKTEPDKELLDRLTLTLAALKR